MSGTQTEAKNRDRAFAFDVKLAEGLAVEGRGDLLEDFLGGSDASRRAHADHARGDIDRVAPDVELIALLSHPAGHHRPGMDADSHLPAEMGVDQGRGHLEPPANRAPPGEGYFL